MALEISPPIVNAGVEYNRLHMRTSNHVAPETDTVQVSCTGTFRPYRKNGVYRQFAPTDKVGIQKVDVPSLTEFAQQLAAEGDMAGAALVAEAMAKYEQCLAKIIEKHIPGSTVTVVTE